MCASGFSINSSVLGSDANIAINRGKTYVSPKPTFCDLYGPGLSIEFKNSKDNVFVPASGWSVIRTWAPGLIIFSHELTCSYNVIPTYFCLIVPFVIEFENFNSLIGIGIDL